MTARSFAVTTLRIRSAATDSPALRLRATRELDAADLAPPSLGPAAVLVVRRLGDPLPGRFGGGGVRPHAEWERAVRESLAVAARAAGRPDGHGRIPPGAAAVLFRDDAEMLACAVAARVRGEPVERWWWRAVVRRLGVPPVAAGSGARDPTPFLLARPRDVPAAVALLAGWGVAGALARALDSGGAAAVLARLAGECGLAVALTGPAPADAGPPGPAQWSGRVNPRLAPPDPGSGAADRAAPPAPWSEWLPAGVERQDVAPAVQALLGVALGLHAAPARIRSAAFAARAEPWWRAVAGSRPGGADRRGGAPAPPGTREPAGRAPRTVPNAGSAPSLGSDSPGRSGARETPGVAATTPAPAVDVMTAAHAPVRDSDDGADRAAGADTGRFAEVAVGPAAPPAAGTGAAAVDAESASWARARPAPAAGAAADDEVVTRAGGILFLIHALEELGLPDSADAGWNVAAEPGPWGVLDLVARSLLGARFSAFAADPLWGTLARLAGRDAGPRPRRATVPRAPAGAADPPYRAPRDWLRRLADPGDDVAWTAHAGRLWLWSSRGYIVAHRRHRGEGGRAASREAVRCLGDGPGPRRLRAAPATAIPWRPALEPPAGCPPRAARWAAVVAPAVLRRVEIALGVGRPGRSSSRNARIADLVAVPGTVHVTPAHVDLVMRLEDARVALRRAGLDRDPGWLPAYGRVVGFHYR